MAGCCDPSGYRHLFNSKEARRQLRAYEKKGLDSMARRIVDRLVADGVEGTSVLEVGGGVGGIQVELLEAGAATAVSVEISDAYETAAAGLIHRRGLADRVERRVGDFTDLAPELSADVTVMNRVICCYPHMERLMDAAAMSTRRVLAITYPRSNPISRLTSRIGNAYLRLRKVDFQSYIHDPDTILDVARRGGFEVDHHETDVIWHGVVLRRVA